MDYKLALKLKEAGFPQDKSEFILRKYSLKKKPLRIARPPVGMEVCILSGKIECEVAEPTLDEMIDEIGEDFMDLSREGKKWWARSVYSMASLGGGKTKKEAVANLWLKLRKAFIKELKDETKTKKRIPLKKVLKEHNLL